MTFVFYFLLLPERFYFSVNILFYNQKSSSLGRNWQVVTLSLDFFDEDSGTPGAFYKLALTLTGRVGKCVANMPSSEATETQLRVFSGHTCCRLPAFPLKQGALFCQPKSAVPWVSALPSTSASCIQNQQGASDWWQPFQSLVFGSRFSSARQAPSQQPLVPFPKL